MLRRPLRAAIFLHGAVGMIVITNAPASPLDEHELLTLKETARLLRVNPRTAWRWCKNGRLPAVKIGHEWRVRKGDLLALLTPRRRP
jgi:excisionase family DNA binding protein